MVTLLCDLFLVGGEDKRIKQLDIKRLEGNPLKENGDIIENYTHEGFLLRNL